MYLRSKSVYQNFIYKIFTVHMLNLLKIGKYTIWVRILEHLDFNGEPISSTRIRKCIADGEIEQANDMLGYNFTFESKVVSGDMRGRTIGFPTLNQHLPNGLVVPKYGVYKAEPLFAARNINRLQISE